MQCLGWFAFSAIPETAKAYYNFKGGGEAIILLILNWGPIMAIPAFPVAVWVLTWKKGFQRSVQIGATLIFLGSLIRCVPCFLGNRSEHFSTVVWLHAGQILFALAGPFIMGSVTALSDIWFPPGERNTSTAISSVANGLGCTLGFLFGPLVASEAKFFPRWLYLHAIITTLIFLCVLLTFPNPPQDQPRLLNSQLEESASVWKNLRLCLTNSSVVLLILGFGLYQGFICAWQGTLQDMFNKVGWSEKRGGMLGFANSISSIGVGFLIGPIVDRYFASRLKAVAVVSIFMTILCQVFFLFTYPNPFHFNPVPRDPWSSLGVIILSGIFSGVTAPPVYELAAEISYPVPPGFSTNLIVLLLNIGTLVNLAVAPKINLNDMNFIVLVQYGVCFILILMAREVYKRRESLLLDSDSNGGFQKLPSPEI